MEARWGLAIVCASIALVVSGAATAGAFPGENGNIAFESNRDGNFEIYVAGTSSPGLANLTDDPASDRNPDWSPDGTKIAFETDRDGNSEIYVMNADGTGLVRLTDDAATDLDPAWSPDGTKLAFASNRGGTFDLYVTDVFTGAVTTVFDDGAADADDTQPTWDSTGAYLAFVSTRSGSSDIWALDVTSEATGTAEPGTDDPADETDPEWTPDSNDVLYAGNAAGNYDIYGVNEGPITSGPGDDRHPTVAPDGSNFAFARDGDVVIFNDGAPTTIAGHALVDGRPDWGAATAQPPPPPPPDPSTGVEPRPTVDPLVPALAWRGERLRFVACDLPEGFEPTSLDAAILDWSGTGAPPAILATSVPTGSDGEPCLSMTAKAAEAGYAVLKLTASDGVGPDVQTRFHGIWMTLMPPVLVNLGGESPGSGLLLVGGEGDSLRARVSGTFPLTGNFAGRLPGDAATLPADWAALAGAFSTSASGWDVHDDQTTFVGHITGPCTPFGFAIDAVDTCLGGSPFGPFSRAPGSFTTAAAVGPYDPQRPDDTLVPDGKVDASDAQMPAAELEIALSGAPAGGALFETTKESVYSRDPAAPLSTPANLFAPFYAAFLPATEAPVSEASGVTGPRQGPSFQGFLDGGRLASGAYEFWRFASVLGSHAGGPNDCDDPAGVPYPKPSGATRVVLYTDEHGEAQVRFRANGFVLNADSQGRCDPGLVGSESVVGQASAAATVRYPYQPVDSVPASNTLAFQSRERGGVSFDCLVKSNVARACFLVVRDALGNPLAGATVSFTREPRGNIQAESIRMDAINDSRDQVVVLQEPDRVIVKTGPRGVAGVLVVETLPDMPEVRAELVDTRQGGFGVMRVWAPPQPVTDTDGDGVDNDVDPAGGAAGEFLDSSLTPPTSGAVSANPAGLSVKVTDADDPLEGVKITIGPGTGQVTLSVCGGFTLKLSAGSEAVITCGSLRVRAVQGPPAEVVLGGGRTVIAVPQDGEARIGDERPDGSFSVENLGDTPVAITVDGVSTTLAPQATSSVTTWDFQGFFYPVENNGVLNVVEAGRPVPLSWRLLDAAGNPVTTVKRAKLTVKSLPCSAGTTQDLPVEQTVGNTLVHLGKGYYVLGWKTPKKYARSCKTLHLDLGEGVTRQALFRFTK